MNDRVLVNLRNQLQEVKNDLKIYNNLYKTERAEKTQLENVQRELIVENRKLLEANDLLRNQLDDVNKHMDAFQVPKPHKKWGNLKSTASKAKRQSQYRRCLDQSLMYLHEAQRARLQLRIGEKEIFFIWSKNDLSRLRRKRKNLERVNRNSDPNETNGEQSDHEADSEDDDIIGQSETDPDAYLANGAWNEIHLMRILNVMDLFKISYKAYHELRMTSRSILPPLNKLKKTRIRMSDEIKCFHHRTVTY